MAGLSWQERTYRRNKARTEGFTDDFYEDNNMAVGTIPSTPESEWQRWAMNSYFLRFAYTYKDRYSATAVSMVLLSLEIIINMRSSPLLVWLGISHVRTL